MIDMNKLSLTGNLVADPETQQAGESTVTRARLIHTESFKDRESGEWKKGEPMAVDFEIWNGYGESFAKAVTKGTRSRLRPATPSSKWMRRRPEISPSLGVFARGETGVPPFSRYFPDDDQPGASSLPKEMRTRL